MNTVSSRKAMRVATVFTGAAATAVAFAPSALAAPARAQTHGHPAPTHRAARRTKQMRKSMLAGAAFALLTSSILIGAAPRADAATTCSGTHCNGQYASNTTCVNGAYVVDDSQYYDTYGTLVGDLQLKYSPSCRTTWGRVISYLGFGGDAIIMNTPNPAQRYTCYIGGGAGTGCNTPMLYDANTTSHAYAEVYGPDGSIYAAWITPSY